MNNIMSMKFATTFLLVLFILILLLSSISWSNTIYVDDSNAGGPWDGTLEHPYQHIQEGIVHSGWDDTVYVFNGIYYENPVVNKAIVLMGENRDSTIVDGDTIGNVITVSAAGVTIRGFKVQHSGSYSAGINISHPSINNLISGNIIVFNASENYGGIVLSSSSNNIITDNIISNNYSRGIYIKGYSSNNSVYGNNISNNSYSGIRLTIHPTNNAIHENTITGNSFGVALDAQADHNSIFDNIISDNTEAGVSVDEYANNNNIFDNTVSNNNRGVIVWFARYNTISGNMILNNTSSGIYIEDRCNVVSKNRIEFCETGIDLWGPYNNVFGNTIKYCRYGLFVDHGDYNVIKSNGINHNETGIFLFSAVSDTIIGNTIADNTSYGVYSRSQSNVFFHNSFINNLPNAWDVGSTDIWDNGYPSGGNYWSDYTGVDADSDGIGDTPYNIPGGNRQDRYPLLYLRGDVNRNLIRDIEDVIYLLNYIYKNGPAPNPPMAGDVNWDEVIDILDVYYLINFLFTSGPSPSF